MSFKLLFSALFLIILLPSVLAIGEDILSNCDLSDEEFQSISVLLDGGVINDSNIQSIIPLADKCNMSLIPDSAWQEVADSVDISDLNISAIENNSQITSILNDLVGSSLCILLNDSNDLVGLEIPGYVPINNDNFNFYLNGTPIVHLSVVEKIITAVDCEPVLEPDYNLFVKDVTVIDTLMNSDDPLDAYTQLKKSGDVVFEGTSFGKKFNVGFMHTALGVINIFR